MSTIIELRGNSPNTSLFSTFPIILSCRRRVPVYTSNTVAFGVTASAAKTVVWPVSSARLARPMNVLVLCVTIVLKLISINVLRKAVLSVLWCRSHRCLLPVCSHFNKQIGLRFEFVCFNFFFI